MELLGYLRSYPNPQEETGTDRKLALRLERVLICALLVAREEYFIEEAGCPFVFEKPAAHLFQSAGIAETRL